MEHKKHSIESNKKPVSYRIKPESQAQIKRWATKYRRTDTSFYEEAWEIAEPILKERYGA
jgi:uncharacterized protein (DUF1778 family)